MSKTRDQYIAEALHEMEQATWPPEKWCGAIQDGYPPGKEYDFERTHNFKAQQALWNAVHPPKEPAPVPPPARDVSRAQWVLFAAQQPEKALNALAKYCVALSADMAYRDASVAVIPKLRAAGHRIAGWCDCRPAPDGTPASAGVKFVADYQLDYFIGQAESSAEFDDAYAHGARVIIGNRSSLRADQIAHLSADVAFIQEDYWNEGWARDTSPDIVAHCAGIYPTALWNPQIQNYRDAGRWNNGGGLYHVAAVEDWQNLP